LVKNPVRKGLKTSQKHRKTWKVTAVFDEPAFVATFHAKPRCVNGPQEDGGTVDPVVAGSSPVALAISQISIRIYDVYDFG
jgi:hypothetical protein